MKMSERPEAPAGISQLLNPEEFRKHLFSDLENTHDYALVKSFLWRNDYFGNAVAEKLLAAASRDVQILLIKDRVGSVYEYGEPNGLSFFNDQVAKNLALYVQGRAISFFYQHLVKPVLKNGLKEELINHPNVRFVEEDLFDHSKVIVIDGKISYVAGINFGYEHLQEEKPWHDFALRLEDPTQSIQLLKQLSGEKTVPGRPDFSRCHHGLNGELEKHLTNFIDGTREELVVCMSYLGNQAYHDSLVQLLKKRRRVKLVVPKETNVNQSSNISALHQLAFLAGKNADALTIVLSPEMIHAKAILRDGESLRVGSQNMTKTDHIAETVVTVSEPAAVSKFQETVSTLEQGSDDIFSADQSKKKLPKLDLANRCRTVLEHGGLRFSELASTYRRDQIERSRQRARRQIQNLLVEFH